MKRLALFGAGLVAALSCGREDVDLAPASPLDGGDAAADATSVSVLDGGVPDGAPASCSDAGRSCRGLDDACATADECCSGRCEGDVCVPAGACLAGDAPCTSRASCCSGACEPIPGTTNRACTGACRREGALCARAEDCCSLGCVGGACVASICKRVGDDCSADAECCSNACTGGKCQLDAVALCRTSGKNCTSGGGSSCCAGCVAGRCDPGPGPCRARGAPCGQTSDCCAGTCVESASGVSFCASTCAPEGAACARSSDCCAGACSASPGVCASTASRCGSIGDPCADGTGCCSGLCIDGRCGDNCPAGPH